MRLINTSTPTLELEEFMGDYEGHYAILSHTWGKEEISFQEMLKTSDSTDIQAVNAIKAKTGYVKIVKAGEVARKEGFKYIWIDTCCIDKTSSAELSEAINSMFRWYQNSEFCIAYLADVSHVVTKEQPRNQEPLRADMSEFSASKWFTRGWTLQELIAPRALSFYSRDWKEIAKKYFSAELLSGITGISKAILRSNPVDLSAASVAEKMFWACKRSTTRTEDMAYCLMGLFDVNMPLLYGEGEKAFQRLQEEIARRGDDHSLFLWQQHVEVDKMSRAFALYRGLFARSPGEFATFRDKIVETGTTSAFTSPSTLTNVGLQTKLPLVPLSSPRAQRLEPQPPFEGSYSDNEYLAMLNCRSFGPNGSDRRQFAIHLIRLIEDQPVYIRVRPHITYLVKDENDEREQDSDIFIQQIPKIYDGHRSFRLSGFFITLYGITPLRLSNGIEPPVLYTRDKEQMHVSSRGTFKFLPYL